MMRAASLIFLILSLTFCHGAKILVYNPSQGHSHSNYMNTLSDLLVKAGHRVVQLQPIYNPNARMGTTKAEVVKVEYEYAKSAIQIDDDVMIEASWRMDGSDPMSIVELSKWYIPTIERHCSELLDQTAVLAKLKDQSFDLAITEPWDACSYAVFNHLRVPQHITTISTYMQDGIALFAGVPVAPAYVPTVSSPYGDKMSFFERLYNLYITAVSCRFHENLMSTLENLYRIKFGSEVPLLRDVLANSSLIFTNSEPLFDFPAPTIAKVVDIGGVSVPARSSMGNLDENWDRILDFRQKTVLISFGSISKSSCLPKKWKETIKNVLRRFPDVTFIWKYERPEHQIGVSVEEATSEGDNLITTTWMPQAKLLSDRRLSSFITHGGIGSVLEATLRGVPMLVIPVVWDQFRNSKMSERTGNAVVFKKELLEDSEQFHDVLKEFLENESYRSNALRLEAMVAERPFSPEETFLKYTEFVLRSGPLPQLVPQGRNLTFVQYFLIDIIIGMFALLIIFLALFVYLTRKFLRICSSKSKTD